MSDEIGSLRQKIATLEAYQREGVADFSSQIAQLQQQLNVLIQNNGVMMGEGATIAAQNVVAHDQNVAQSGGVVAA